MLRTLNVLEEVEKEVVPFGNGSIVYTPKKWIGQRVRVILEKKPFDVGEEVLAALKPHLSLVEGVFLFGSFARGEQSLESDIDVLVVASEGFGLKKQGRIDFLVKTRKQLLEGLERDSELFFWQALSEAKPLLNESLLIELRKIKPRQDFSEFFDSVLVAFKNVSLLLEAERKAGKKFTDSGAIIYSLVLRLKGLFLLQCFLKKKRFSSNGFGKMLESHGFGSNAVKSFLQVYRSERDEKKLSVRLPLGEAEKLFEAAKVEFIKAEEMVKG